jgi:hypothetical protein
MPSVRASTNSPMRAFMGVLRGAWELLPEDPAPEETLRIVREKRDRMEEEELAWLEKLAACVGRTVAMARASHPDEVRVKPILLQGMPCCVGLLPYRASRPLISVLDCSPIAGRDRHGHGQWGGGRGGRDQVCSRSS